MISSYILPDESDMLQLFAPIEEDIFIVKDEVGETSIPQFTINNIGDWDIIKGYQVKAETNTILPLSGVQVQPENYTIPIKEGWQIIAYLRDQPQELDIALDDILPYIEILKNNQGNTFIPNFGINDIGALIPGQGYKLRSTGETNLIYLPNSQAPEVFHNTLPTQHFLISDANNSGNNSTLLFLEEALQGITQAGDEIGIFDAEGQLCGAGVVTNQHMAITVWGDDDTTDDIQEGMHAGSHYDIKIWNAASNEEYTTKVAYEAGDSLYAADDLEIINQISLETTSLQEISQLGRVQLFPNPADVWLYLDLDLNTFANIRLNMLDLNGREIVRFGAYSLFEGQHRLKLTIPDFIPNGLYILRLETKDGMNPIRFVLQR